jgi:secretion/DNA translocation related TadE-like protein
VLAAAMIGVLVTFAVAGACLGAAVIARHRAQAAADLGALAAAGALTAGPEVACAQATAVASAMRTTVAQCRVEDLDVVLTVHAEVRLGRWGMGPATAAARAGPGEPTTAA